MASSFREFAFSKTSWHFAGAAHFAQRRAISAGELKRTLMIEIGLVGFGLAGRAFHAPVICAVPGLHLAAILQRSGNEAAEKYPHVRIVRSLDELLAMAEIRLVVIATPNDTHYSLARQCLAAGRDVVVDKPFATTLEEAKSLVQFAKDSGRMITVYQNRRYDGDFQAIRKLVADGTLGRIV